MMITRREVESLEISGIQGLDPIQVFWSDVSDGVGSVTITCYGSAWTAYWGAMGHLTVKEFFLQADVGYLINKLGYAPTLKERKKDLEYLSRIVKAIKAAGDTK